MTRAVHAGSLSPHMPNGCWGVLVALQRLTLLPNSIRNRARCSRVAHGMASSAVALHLRIWPDGRLLLRETARDFSGGMERWNNLRPWNGARRSLEKRAPGWILREHCQR